MNIGVISPQIYPCTIGGIEIFNYYFIKKLTAQKHKIWVFTCCDYNWGNKNIHSVKLWNGCPGLNILSINCSIILNFIKLKNRINLVHFPYTSNSPLVYPLLIIKKLFGIPYIITIHGGGMYEWKPKIFHKLFFKHAESIVAVSVTIKNEYELRSGRKIKLIPPLIPFGESKIPKSKLKNKYGFSNKDVIILSLGSIKKIKGSNVLLDAFLKLGKEYIKANNLKLLYVGDGAMRKNLERDADEKNFSQYIKFLGNMPHENVPEMYKLADIYVISSLTEGTPIALLEAMFNGLPIIGTNVSGISNLIVNMKNGLLFENKDSDDLKNKIGKLIADITLAKRLGNSAKNDYDEGYTFENVISDHIRLFKEVVER